MFPECPISLNLEIAGFTRSGFIGVHKVVRVVIGLDWLREYSLDQKKKKSCTDSGKIGGLLWT